MATTQLHRTTAQSKNWAQIFPNEQVTEQKSCLFVKKLLAVAISNITYLRAIFPENAFGDKCLEDLNLKILRDESSCPGACQVINWVKGCFDALEKKYLKTLVIGIYVDPNKPETLIESYSFKFSYTNDGEVDIYRNEKKISSAHSPDATKTATIRLLRTLIILTNTLSSLPDNVMMTMKLFYFDDVTPEDYEPPGFKAADDTAFVFDQETTNIAVGQVETPFHMVKLRVKTGKEQFDVDAETMEQTQEQPETEEICSVSNKSLDDDGLDASQAVTDVASEKQAPGTCDSNKSNRSKSALSTTEADSVPEENAASPARPEVNEDDFTVRCPCGCNEDDGLMIMCSICKFWQHGICFLITNEEKAPSDHICDVCSRADPSLTPTDPHLNSLSAIAVQATCLWRRALTACTEFKRIVAPQLARRLGIENAVAQGLINRLEKEGFLNTASRGKKLGKTVDKDKITKEGIPRYLKTPKALTKSFTTDVEMPVDALVEKTNKMDISGGRRKRAAKQVEQIDPPVEEPRGRRGKKRAYSKADSAEFEISNSQEVQRAKKKASTVNRDITV